MKCSLLAAAAAAIALPVLVLAQGAQLPTKEPAKPAAAPAAAKDGPLATVNGVAISRQRAAFVLRQHAARGTPDSEQLRARVRDVLINNEIVAQEANRTGFTKKPEVQLQLELARQEIIVNTYLNDYISKTPITDAEIQTEYERVKAQTGTTEYKARHILVENEDEAKRLIAELKKGGKFDELARKGSKDPGSKDRGGELDWNVPGNFDKSFADAIVKIEKGKLIDAPVRTRFGFHVIQLDDVRALKFPPLTEVTSQLQNRLAQLRVDKMISELRAKSKIE
jgi:peptidyl-prolyl cis-trans isomerase C